MYLSEYCDVNYEETYNVVFVKWKKFCCKGNYRKPLKHALEVIKQYKCNYVADTRTGFENIPEDTKWVAEYFALGALPIFLWAPPIRALNPL